MKNSSTMPVMNFVKQPLKGRIFQFTTEPQMENGKNVFPRGSGAQRVQNYFDRNGFDFTVVELPGSTRTAQEAAESVGCSVSQIAKSLIFKDKNDYPVLVIVAGSNRVDTKKIQNATGTRLGRADGTFVKEQVGFAIGGVPPAGHKLPLKTFLDPDLKNHREIWAAAGSPHALFKLSPEDLDTLTGGTWLELAEG